MYVVRGEAGGSEESTGGKGLGQKKPGDSQSQQNPQPIVVNVGSYHRGTILRLREAIEEDQGEADQ